MRRYVRTAALATALAILSSPAFAMMGGAGGQGSKGWGGGGNPTPSQGSFSFFGMQITPSNNKFQGWNQNPSAGFGQGQFSTNAQGQAFSPGHPSYSGPK